MIKIEDLTIGQARELAAMFNTQLAPQSPKAADAHWEIGKPYLIRTVTMIDTGRLVAVTDKELVLEDAAWVADTGRFSDSVKKAEFDEVEPFPDGKVIINRSSIIDAVIVNKIQRSQK
jgi:hypothetical protein